MRLEQTIEQAREVAKARAYLYEDERTYIAGVEEALRLIEDDVRERRAAASA